MAISKLHAILILVALSRTTSLTIPNEQEPKLNSEEILDIESVTDSVEFVTVQNNLEEDQDQLQENLDLAISRNSVTNFYLISVKFVCFLSNLMVHLDCLVESRCSTYRESG